VTRLVSAKSLSCIVPPGTLCPTSPSLPWVAWVSLPHGQQYYAPLRRPPVLLGVLRLSLAPRYLACCPRAWSPRRARGLVEAPSPHQGLWAPGPPLRAWVQGHRWTCVRSHGFGLTLARPVPGSVAVGQGWDRGCGFPKALQAPLTRTRRSALWPLPGVDSLPARR
jgi:hypothetical protein